MESQAELTALDMSSQVELRKDAIAETAPRMLLRLEIQLIPDASTLSIAPTTLARAPITGTRPAEIRNARTLARSVIRGVSAIRSAVIGLRPSVASLTSG